MWSDRAPRPGDVVTGRWRGASYRIVEELGSGANGRVYLVAAGGKRYALKIGYDVLDLQLEINGLNELRHAPDAAAGCFLVDSDDWDSPWGTVPFYVMQYVPGVHPKTFLRENGSDWYPVIGYRILTRLAQLHERGYIFGDLKSANILVSGYGTTELIDYGGLTKFGNAVRQYTERYDRGFWRAGSRTAEPSYDLFSFAVLCLELADDEGNHLAALEAGSSRSVDDLLQLAERLPASRIVASVIRACLTGEMKNAVQAQHAWRTSVYAALSNRRPRHVHHQRASSKLTAGLTAVLALCVTVFSAVAYWTFR